MKVLIACEESQTVCMAFRVEPLGLWVGSSSSRRDAKKKHKYQADARFHPGLAARRVRRKRTPRRRGIR